MENEIQQDAVETEGTSVPDQDKALAVQDGMGMMPTNTEIQADDALVEEAVQFIKEKVTETLYRGSMEIGEYIIMHFFGNDEEQVASRSPKKLASYRKLSNREDLPISKSTLHDMLSVAKQERFFAKHNLDTSALSYTHKVKLIRLANEEGKILFVQNIIGETLSVRELAERVQEQKGASQKPSSTDSQAPSPPSKMLKELKSLLTEPVLKKLDSTPDELGKLSADEKKDLEGKITETVKKLSDVMKTYKKIAKELKEMSAEEGQ